MGAARMLLVGLLLVACACGSASRPAAVVSPTKPSPEPSKLYPSPTAQPSSPPWIQPFEAIDFIDRSNGWAVVLSDAAKAVEIVRTTDGGTTWSPPVRVTSLNVVQGEATPRFGVHFASARYGWVYGAGIFATLDGGATWIATSIRATVFDLGVAGDSVWEVSGCDFRAASPCPGAMMESRVGTVAWAPRVEPRLGLGPFVLVRVDRRVAYIAEQAQFETRLFRTGDGGTTWREVSTPCSRGYAMPFATQDGVHLWMVCGSQPGAGEQGKWAYTSDDSGAHWTLRSFNDGASAAGTIPVIGYANLLSITDTSTGFMADDRGDVYRSTDTGKTWTALGISGGEGFFYGLQFVDSSTGWIAGLTGDYTDISLFRTTNGGAIWTRVSAMPRTA